MGYRAFVLSSIFLQGNKPRSGNGGITQEETCNEELGTSTADRFPRSTSPQSFGSNLEFPKVEPVISEVILSETISKVIPGETISEEIPGEVVDNNSLNNSCNSLAPNNTALGILRTNLDDTSVDLTKSIPSTRIWPKETVLEFIKIYESQPALWNPANPYHKDKNVIMIAWEIIRLVMQGQYTVEELRKKKKSLMQTYRVVKREMKQRDQQGIDPADVCKPTWFAYSMMDRFLSTVYMPRIRENTKDKIDESQNMTNDQSVISEKDKTNDHSVTSEKDETNDNVHSIFIESAERDFEEESRHSRTSLAHQIKEENITTSGRSIMRRIRVAYKMVKAMRKKRHKDDCDLYGELLATKLRKVDQRTRIIVMNDIDNLIFSATKMNPIDI